MGSDAAIAGHATGPMIDVLDPAPVSAKPSHTECYHHRAADSRSLRRDGSVKSRFPPYDKFARPRLKKSVWQVVVVANMDEAAKRFAKKMTFIIRHTPVC